MANYWSCHINGDGKARKLAADYIVETSAEAVTADLNSEDGYLPNYLRSACRMETAKIDERFLAGAEALLGGLAAGSDCSLRFGVWVGGVPRVKSIPQPENLGAPVMQENGLRLWLMQQELLQSAPTIRPSVR
jgi:hypothetical protein